MSHDQKNITSQIILRLPREQKGRYVAASRAAGTTLAGWILQQLDAASESQAPAEPDHPGTPPDHPPDHRRG